MVTDENPAMLITTATPRPGKPEKVMTIRGTQYRVIFDVTTAGGATHEMHCTYQRLRDAKADAIAEKPRPIKYTTYVGEVNARNVVTSHLVTNMFEVMG